MAITVNIYYNGKNGNAKKFAEEMVSSGTVNKIRAEAGNLKYEYFFPMDDEETVLLIDSWKDQESIDVHHASPMMEQISKLRDKYELHMKVERYVSDETGIPDSDKVFIKGQQVKSWSEIKFGIFEEQISRAWKKESNYADKICKTGR